MTFFDCGYGWTKNLEGVLEDGVALDVFKQWIKESSPQAKAALDLHFAIKAFKDFVEQSDSKATEVACKIHRRFISMKTGCCDFVPSSVRKEMSERVHSLSTTNPPRATFFNPCTEHVLAYLRKQYDLFVSSSHFQELCSRSFVVEDVPSTSYSRNPSLPPHHCIAKPSQPYSNSVDWPKRTNKTSRQLRLTPNVHCSTTKSSKSDWEMQNLQCDESSRKVIGKKLNERNGNNTNLAFSPFVNEGSRFTHEISEERSRFAAILSSKLQMIADLIEQKQRETGKDVFAREVSTNSAIKDVSPTFKVISKHNQETDSVISDEDLLTSYVEKMNDADSDKQPSGKSDRRRSASLSPNPFNDHSSRIYTRVSNPYGERGFAPPPGGIWSQELPYSCSHSHISQVPRSGTPLSNGGYGGHRLSDSSGFCSAESANIVNIGALYRKARHIASQECSNQGMTLVQRGFNTRPTPLHAIVTLPRVLQRLQDSRRHGRCRGAFGMLDDGPLLNVSYKEENGEAPFVAKLHEKEITFREFRRCFGISSKSNKKFFFKSVCEDGSAPYQWTTISDDHTYLPIFQGRVTAECRTFSESD